MEADLKVRLYEVILRLRIIMRRRFIAYTGVRGDVRYVRTAGMSDSDANPFGLDLTRFEFWRASAGLVVKF